MSISNSLLPVFVDWRHEEKTYRVPILQFSNDLETALILHNKEFIKVNIKDVTFGKWDL